MEQLIPYIPYILIAFPLFSTIIIYQIRIKMVQQSWKAVHSATQLSAIFYVVAVAFLLKLLFDSYFIGSILIFLICILAIVLIIQWKKHMEVVLYKGLKILLRISFLLFSVLYYGLLLYWGLSYFIAG